MARKMPPASQAIKRQKSSFSAALLSLSAPPHFKSHNSQLTTQISNLESQIAFLFSVHPAGLNPKTQISQLTT